MKKNISLKSKIVIENINRLLLVSFLILSCKTPIGQQENTLGIDYLTSNELNKSISGPENIPIEKRYSLESRLEETYSTKEGHIVNFLRDENTGIISANIKYNSAPGFSKEEILPVICEKNQNVAEILQTVTLENSKHKIHFLDNKILIGDQHLCGGMPLPTIGYNDYCPKGCSRDRCKHPRTDPPTQVFYHKGKRWDRGEGSQYEDSGVSISFGNSSESLFREELLGPSLPSMAEIRENGVKIMQRIEDITLSSIRINEESRRKEEERVRAFQEYMRELGENNSFREKESKRQAPLSFSSADAFVEALWHYKLGELRESIEDIDNDINGANKDKSIFSKLKNNIVNEFNDIKKYIDRLKPLYVNTKYGIDPRICNLQGRDYNIIDDYLNNLIEQREKLAGILIRNKEEPKNYGYSKESIGLTPEYLEKERLKQENALYTKWQVIYQTKSDAEKFYLKVKHDKNEANIHEAKESLRDAFANCVQFDQMLNNKYKAESKKNLYHSPKTEEDVEVLQLEADYLKYLLYKGIGSGKSMSTEKLYETALYMDSEYASDVVFTRGLMLKVLELNKECAKYDYRKYSLIDTNLDPQLNLEKQVAKDRLLDLRLKRNTLLTALNEDGDSSSDEEDLSPRKQSPPFLQKKFAEDTEFLEKQNSNIARIDKSIISNQSKIEELLNQENSTEEIVKLLEHQESLLNEYQSIFEERNELLLTTGSDSIKENNSLKKVRSQLRTYAKKILDKELEVKKTAKKEVKVLTKLYNGESLSPVEFGAKLTKEAEHKLEVERTLCKKLCEMAEVEYLSSGGEYEPFSQAEILHNQKLLKKATEIVMDNIGKNAETIIKDLLIKSVLTAVTGGTGLAVYSGYQFADFLLSTPEIIEQAESLCDNYENLSSDQKIELCLGFLTDVGTALCAKSGKKFVMDSGMQQNLRLAVMEKVGAVANMKEFFTKTKFGQKLEKILLKLEFLRKMR